MKHGRTDANQTHIVNAIRDAYVSVQILSDVGGGFPDTLWGACGVTIVGPVCVEEIRQRLTGLPVVAHDGANLLVEIKTDAGRLEDSQVDWHERWRGQVAVARTIPEALRLVGLES